MDFSGFVRFAEKQLEDNNEKLKQNKAELKEYEASVFGLNEEETSLKHLIKKIQKHVDNANKILEGVDLLSKWTEADLGELDRMQKMSEYKRLPFFQIVLPNVTLLANNKDFILFKSDHSDFTKAQERVVDRILTKLSMKGGRLTALQELEE